MKKPTIVRNKDTAVVKTGLFSRAKVINTKTGNEVLSSKQQLQQARLQQATPVQMAKAIGSSVAQTAGAIAGSRAASKVSSNIADNKALASYLNVIKGGEGGASGGGSTTEVGGSGSKLGG